MNEWIGNYQSFLKALHIIFVMFWMGGLYYLPRIFVYHAESYENNNPIKIFEIMEKKLINFILIPSMLLTLFLGLLLFYISIIFLPVPIWMFIKLLCVFILFIYQILLISWHKKFLLGKTPKTSRFFRIINEIPPILTIIIVLMVVIKPFL